MTAFIKDLANLLDVSETTLLILLGALLGIGIAKLFSRSNTDRGASMSGQQNATLKANSRFSTTSPIDDMVTQTFTSEALALNVRGTQLHLAEEQLRELQQLLATNRKIEAIKLLREITGIALVDAKSICEALSRSLEQRV